MHEKDFVFSPEKEPHRTRTKQILKEHPEIKDLIGKNPYTFFVLFFIVASLYTLSYFLRDQAWWLIFVVAYTYGALASHTLFVLIHECAHNLLFKKRPLNALAGILANMPQVLPSSVSFARYHIKHHSFQGVFELDADLPSKWEAKLIRNSTIGKMLWLLFYPVFQMLRVGRLREIKPIDEWILLNWFLVFGADAAVIIFLGPKAFLFLLSSLFFSIGLHPLGGRWIQEHYLTAENDQETFSYYGILNVTALNVGYHNEHHDFPSIPWNKLPLIKKIGGRHYDDLHSHRSWTLLWLRFLFDKRLSLYSRVTRNERGNVKLTDESTPDTDLIAQEKELVS